MIQDFNIFNEYEIPNVSICYPNRVKIGDLGRITNLEINVKFNTYSEITIDVPYKDNEIVTPYYEYLISKNKIHIENYGYFIIQDVKETDDGITKKKTIPAYSEECSLNYRSMNFLEGTYKFYDTNPEEKTIMSIIMSRIPNWTLESVSSSLWNKYRTFNNTNSTLYSLMMTTISKAYECFFIFDTEERKIYVKDTSEIVNNVPIYLSYDNLVNNVEISSKSDEYVTALSVTGGGDLDIRTVNPLGTDFIYNFSYPLSKGQMTSGLASSLSTWNNKIVTYQPTYATTLSEYKTANETLLSYQSDLTDLKSQRTAIELLMETRLNQGIKDMSDLAAQIATIDANISGVQSNINATELIIAQKNAILVGINTELKMENNFTTDQYNELLDYVIESSYQNENIIQTSIMTNVEIQEQAQELYDQGVNVLSKISQPRFEFTLDSVNFIFLKEYLSVTNLLQIGSVITIELDENTNATPVLLEIKFNFYKPNEFSLTFGNRYRLDDSAYTFAELIQETINRGSNVAVDTPLWKDWSTNHQKTVSNFVQNSLDASKNNLINASNQQIIINETGLKARRLLESGAYDDRQFWVINNTLAFTDDNWNTVKTALGQIVLPDESVAYGLVADAIVAGTIYTELIKILGDTNFYWDNKNIVIQNPSNINQQIRIGKYDGANYGIGFTSDGGTTWKDAINFNGVQISSGLQTDYITILNDAITIASGGKINIQSGGSVNIQTDDFQVKNSDAINMLRVTAEDPLTGEPGGVLELGEDGYPVRFGGSFILPLLNGGFGDSEHQMRWVTTIPSDDLGIDGDVAVVYNTNSGTYSDITPIIGSYETATRFGKSRIWNYERISGYRACGNTDSTLGGSYWSFTTPSAGLSGFTLQFTEAKYVGGVWYGWNVNLPITIVIYSSLSSTTPLASTTFIPNVNATLTSVGFSFSYPLSGDTTYYIAMYDDTSSYNKSRVLIQNSTVLIPGQTGVSYNGVYIKTNGTYEQSDLALTTIEAHKIDPSAHSTLFDAKVPTTRTVNSKALSSNITLSASDVGAVPTSRTVNGHALSSNVTLDAGDVGAEASGSVSTHNSSGSAHSSLFAAKQATINLTGLIKGSGSGSIGLTTAGITDIQVGTSDPGSLATGVLYLKREA